MSQPPSPPHSASHSGVWIGGVVRMVGQWVQIQTPSHRALQTVNPVCPAEELSGPSGRDSRKAPASASKPHLATKSATAREPPASQTPWLRRTFGDKELPRYSSGMISGYMFAFGRAPTEKRTRLYPSDLREISPCRLFGSENGNPAWGERLIGMQTQSGCDLLGFSIQSMSSLQPGPENSCIDSRRNMSSHPFPHPTALNSGPAAACGS